MAFLNLQYQSQSLYQAVQLSVLLPYEYQTEKEGTRFRTLYFLPGFSSNQTEMITYLRLRELSDRYHVAVVIPDGYNSFYVDHPKLLKNFGSFIGEIVSVTRALLPLSAKQSDTFIGGVSMGGLGALVHGKRYDGIFSKIIALSPAVNIKSLMVESVGGFSPDLFIDTFKSEEGYETYANYIKAYLSGGKANQRNLFLACGRQDPLVYQAVSDFHQDLVKAGIPHQYMELDGGHDFIFWNQVLEAGFRFLVEPTKC